MSQTELSNIAPPPNAWFHGSWVRKVLLLPVSLIAFEPIVLVPVVGTDNNHRGRV